MTASQSQPTFSIRVGQPGDVEGIAAFQVRHAQEVEGLTLDPATVARGVTHIFEVPALGFYLVAERNGAAENARDDANGHAPLCGCLLVLSEWSDWRAREVWWIHSVYVAPEHRGQRLFDALYAQVEDLARQKGAAGLRLYVDKRNTTAQRVYTRLGMNKDHYELFERMF